MVNVLDKDKILWYVMRAYKNENTAEDRLSNETYGLEYFIPKQKVLRTVKGKKVFFKEIYIETERIIIRNFKQKDAEGLLDYLFREAGARRIYGFVEDDNIRSKRLCERLGMRREGCFKEFVTFVNNPDGSPKYEDTCVYAILEKEWNTIRQW